MIDIEVKYYFRGAFSHQYKEVWDKSEDFKYCPNCGNKTVYESQGVGDYYEGTEVICISCASTWKNTGGIESLEGDEQGQQRLDQICAASDYITSSDEK